MGAVGRETDLERSSGLGRLRPRSRASAPPSGAGSRSLSPDRGRAAGEFCADPGHPGRAGAEVRVPPRTRGP